jgi:hypothetical protein
MMYLRGSSDTFPALSSMAAEWQQGQSTNRGHLGDAKEMNVTANCLVVSFHIHSCTDNQHKERSQTSTRLATRLGLRTILGLSRVITVLHSIRLVCTRPFRNSLPPRKKIC